MNLHQIVRGAITTVNPDVTATLRASTGVASTQPNGKRVPGYAAPVTAQVQVQALSWRDLQLISGLNIQGEARAIYLNGDWRAVIRPGDNGGDLIEVLGRSWLNVKTVEQWENWTKMIVVRQMEPA